MSHNITSRSRAVLGVATVALAIGGAGVLSAQSTTAAPAAAPEVFAGFDDLDVIGANATRTNTVTFPSGVYSIVAKAYVDNSSASSSRVSCRLSVGSQFDDSQAATNSSTRQAALSLAVVQSAVGPTSTTLSCTNTSTSSVNVRFVKIVATRVNLVSNRGM